MIYYFIMINIVSFLMFGVDKKRSVKKKYRISEAFLFLLSIVGGCFGSLFGMFYYHHKNRKLKFLISIPATCLIWVLILLYIEMSA